MHESSVKSSLVMVWWRPTMFTHLDPLRQTLIGLGYEKMVPPARTSAAALRSALEEVFPTRTHRVEALKSRNAFEVITISRGEQRNDYAHHLRVGIDDDNAVEVQPFHSDIAHKIVAAFNNHRGLVTSAGVTKSLLEVIYALKGTRLRDDGGLYGLPGDQKDAWRTLARAIEMVPTHGGKSWKVYLCHHEMDEDTVRCVRDAICAEVESQAMEIKQQVLLGELGERALMHRQSLAAGLQDKIKLYEGLLGEGLAHLRSAVESADEAVCAATILISAGPEVGELCVA